MNSLGKEIERKIVVLSYKRYKRNGCTRRPETRAFICRGGFGCSPHTGGTAVFGTFLVDGEEARIEGYDIERRATIKESRKWFKAAKVKGLLERCVE